MTDPTPESTTSPYVSAAGIYRTAGWRGVLPLPARSKKPVPSGFTGHDGAWPSGGDIQQWLDEGVLIGDKGTMIPAGNIALRLPGHIVGLDIDNYDDKLGLSSYGQMLAKWGPLPNTWRSSSRSDNHSGIYLFTVPEGLVWPGAPAAGIEIIQLGHRYVVAWPSVHPEGGVYRWHDPNGAVVINAVPQVDELPALPASWVEGLTGGQVRGDVPKAGLVSAQVETWLKQHGGGEPCQPAMASAIARYLTEFTTSGLSRHDIAMRATARITRLITDGHSGGRVALATIESEFHRAIEHTAHRGGDTGEWARLVEGAVNLAAVEPVEPRDPCFDPFATLLNRSASSSPPVNATAAAAATPKPGTSPSAPASPAGAPVTDPAPTPREMLLAQEIERLRAQRGARKTLDEEDAVALFREPVWVRTLTDELALPDSPTPFVVAEVFPAGANVLLTAQFKAGKTTLVNNLTRSLVDGLPFLDRFAVEGEHRVALFNYEVSRDQFRLWLRDAAIEHTDRVTVLNLRGYRMPLITPRIEDWIVTWLVEHAITCWVLDPFARAFVGSGDNENDNSLVGRFLDSLDIIKARANVRELVMPTHTGRVAQEAGSERARGATRLDDWADVRWLLTTNEDGNRFFRAVGRDVDFAEVQLGYNTSSRRVFIDGPGRKKRDNQDLRAEIIKAVRTSPGITATGIVQVVGGSKTKVLAKINAMVDMVDLRRDGDGHTGYRHYVVDRPILSLVPGVVPEGGSGVVPGGSEVVQPVVPRTPFRVRNHGGSESSSDEPDDDLPATSLSLTRDQLEEQTACFREALQAGKEPRYQPDGRVLDQRTGEVIWQP